MNPVYKTFSTLNGFYVFDRGRNSILKITEQEFDLLNRKDPDTIIHFRNNGFLEDNLIKHIKHENSDQLEQYLENKLEKMTIQLTQGCNLKCSYCPYNGSYENRSYSNKKISLETIKKGIDFFLSHSRYTEQIAISFYGGEPLLEMELLKKSVEYARNAGGERKIHFNLTTNGTLFTDDIVEYLLENGIYVLLSLDGSKESHDKNRVYHNGNGSFDTIMRNLEHIQDKYPDFFSLLSVNAVIDPNNDFSGTNAFFNTSGLLSQVTVEMNTVSEFNIKDEVQYSEDFKVTNDYESCKAYLNMLGYLPEEPVSRLYQLQKGKVNIIYKTLRPFRMEGDTMHPGGQCMPGVSRLLLDVDGNFYPCERVSEESEIMKIGNVDDGIDMEKARYLLNVGRITEQECIGCYASNLCKICIAWVDGNTELSREKKLQHCRKMQQNVIKEIRVIAILKELGYRFEGSQF